MENLVADLNHVKIVKQYLVKYAYIHQWIAKQLGKPKKCAKCGTETAKQFHWANISYEYKKDITDWIRLCARCHKKMDLEARPRKRFTHCFKGHELTKENTWIRDNGDQACLECRKLRAKQYIKERLISNPNHYKEVFRKYYKPHPLIKKTHCKQGHEFNEKNTWFDIKRNIRHCRVCLKIRQNLNYHAKKGNYATSKYFQSQRTI